MESVEFSKNGRSHCRGDPCVVALPWSATPSAKEGTHKVAVGTPVAQLPRADPCVPAKAHGSYLR